MNKEEFLKIYNALPKPLQEALYSDKISLTIRDTGSLAKLSAKGLFILNETTTDVLLGQISPENFAKELKTRLKISDTSLEIINRIIQDKIFNPLNKALEECKHSSAPKSQPLKQKIPIEFSVPPKISPATEEKAEQAITEQIPSEPIIPEYSFPEPSEVKVEKPVSKIEELKKVVAPRVSSEQQEKIREKLLAAMQKKDVQPEIVEKMKKVIFKKPVPKEKKEPLKKKSIGEVASSKVLGGEGEKFKDEEVFKKTEKEKPYIIDVKLKEEKEKKAKTPLVQEPIPYKKYQKENPFGQA